MKISDVNPAEYNPYYNDYINKVPMELTLIEAYTKGENEVLQFFKNISSAKWDYKYQPEKWSIKELFQHVIDTERIFMYRCFRIARHDKTPLPGFEENQYILPSRACEKSVENLLEEYKSVRQSSIALLKSLNEEDLSCLGNVSGHNISARAIAFILLGHEIHHIQIVRRFYLN